MSILSIIFYFVAFIVCEPNDNGLLGWGGGGIVKLFNVGSGSCGGDGSGSKLLSDGGGSGGGGVTKLLKGGGGGGVTKLLKGGGGSGGGCCWKMLNGRGDGGGDSPPSLLLFLSFLSLFSLFCIIKLILGRWEAFFDRVTRHVLLATSSSCKSKPTIGFSASKVEMSWKTSIRGFSVYFLLWGLIFP